MNAAEVATPVFVLSRRSSRGGLFTQSFDRDPPELGREVSRVSPNLELFKLELRPAVHSALSIATNTQKNDAEVGVGLLITLVKATRRENLGNLHFCP